VDVFEERLNKMDTTDLEANREKSEAVAVRQEVPNKEAEVETILALEDRYGDRRLTVGRRGRPEKWAQGDGGSRQKLAPARGRLTHRAIPALRKGRSRRGPGKTTGNGIRGRSERQQLPLGWKESFYEALGQTIELETAKRRVGSFMKIRKTSVKTLWRSRSLPKPKKKLQTA
jgi:hypothetical protein